MKQKNKHWDLLPTLPFFLLVGLFLFLPLISMVLKSFQMQGTGQITLQNYIDIVTKPIYQVTITNSIYLSVVSSVIGIVLSFFLALALVTVGERGKNMASAILNMVSNFAGLPLAIAFIVVLGTSGVLTTWLVQANIPLFRNFDLYSKNGLLLLYVYFQIPLGTLMLLPAFQSIQPAWKEAAALLHATPIQFWWSVGIPVLRASLFDTFSMLFANALTAYATPFMLMTTNLPLLPVKLASMFTGEMRLQQEMGSALSITMLLLMLVVIALGNLGKRILCKGGMS